MAGRGCSRHEEDEEDEEHDRSCGEDHCGGQHHTKSAHATHGSGMPSSSSSASGPMRPGAHLSRDEKRGLGSWAGSGPTLHLGPRPACCKCKERPATVRHASMDMHALGRALGEELQCMIAHVQVRVHVPAPLLVQSLIGDEEPELVICAGRALPNPGAGEC